MALKTHQYVTLLKKKVIRSTGGRIKGVHHHLIQDPLLVTEEVVCQNYT